MSNLTSLTKKQKAAESASSFIEEADKESRGSDDTAASESGEKGKRLNVEIPPGLHKQLKQAALDRDCSVRNLVIEGIELVIK
jgi:predicted HicB family RNase H-like nuclease